MGRRVERPAGEPAGGDRRVNRREDRRAKRSRRMRGPHGRGGGGRVVEEMVAPRSMMQHGAGPPRALSAHLQIGSVGSACVRAVCGLVRCTNLRTETRTYVLTGGPEARVDKCWVLWGTAVLARRHRGHARFEKAAAAAGDVRRAVDTQRGGRAFQMRARHRSRGWAGAVEHVRPQWDGDTCWQSTWSPVAGSLEVFACC